MPKLMIIVASTRPSRKGPAVARWFTRIAEEHDGFEVEVVDLAELALPFLDEPEHPRLRRYTHEHTLRWSAMVDAADAFAVVTPEYNYGYPAPLKNAIDFVWHEWNYKPLGFVNYGGLAGGTRAQAQLRQVAIAVKLFPLNEAVNLPLFTQRLGEDGEFDGGEASDQAARAMLDELLGMEGALRPLREPAATR